MKCTIIQDLLPLYCDGLTSSDSNEEIEKHLRECENCNNIYENMNVKENNKIQTFSDISPLKKVKKRNFIKILSGIFGTAIVGTIIFLFLFWGVIPATSDKVTMEISCYDRTVKTWYFEGGNEVTEYENPEDFAVPEEHVEKCIDINFIGDYSCTRENFYNDMEFNSDGTITSHYEITIYPEIKIPFDNRGEHPNQLEVGFPVTDNPDTLTIHYLDKDVTYTIAELAEQYYKAD